LGSERILVARRLIGHLGLCLTICIATSIAHAFSIQEEIKLGIEAAKQVEKEMPLSKNTTWQQEIASLGSKMLPYLKRKDVPYSFKIVEAKNEINAFTLPGGFVYFTEQMWRIMTRDERAAILAHEIVHSDHRHGVDQMLKSQQRALWMLPVIVMGGAGLSEAMMWGNVAIAQRYSRKMEQDADKSGIRLMAQAGFNPAGAVTAMKKLLNIEANENRYEISAIFASHPDTAKRIAYIEQIALSLGASKTDFALKAVDDPTRLGNVTNKFKDVNAVSAKTFVPVEYGNRVVIKKMLWDDDAQALIPKQIATAIVLTPGRLPTLLVETPDDSGIGDVMVGDGVYAD
jgi:predicted Zn-dependent protease